MKRKFKLLLQWLLLTRIVQEGATSVSPLTEQTKKFGTHRRLVKWKHRYTFQNGMGNNFFIRQNGKRIWSAIIEENWKFSALIMLVLFETAAGYAVLKVRSRDKGPSIIRLWFCFSYSMKRNYKNRNLCMPISNQQKKWRICTKIRRWLRLIETFSCCRLKLIQFERFEDTTNALAAATATVEGKISKPLKNLLKTLVESNGQEKLLVADGTLGKAIKVWMILFFSREDQSILFLGQIRFRLYFE